MSGTLRGDENSLAFQSGNPKERGHLVVEGLDGRISLKATEYDGMECIRLDQSRDQWRTPVITEMDLHLRQNAGRSVTILAAVGVQKRSRLRKFDFLAGNRRGRCRSVANTVASNTLFLFRSIQLPVNFIRDSIILLHFYPTRVKLHIL